MRAWRRMAWAVVMVVGWLSGPAVASASAQEAVFLVRHTERADTSSDSLLSPAGETRAARLAEFLRDAGISTIFTTQYRRTIDTASPLATKLGLSIVQVPGGQHAELIERVRALGPKARVLIVGHSNTVPALLTALGSPLPVTIADDEFDNLFVVVPGPASTPTILRLRY
jgi:broad specificity phosphatase PhoE